jgi:hypothetical protein
MRLQMAVGSAVWDECAAESESQGTGVAGHPRNRAVIVVGVLVCPMASFSQGIPSTPITLTDKITSLDGVWTYDRGKGVRGSCDLDEQNDRIIRIGVSPQGLNIESERLKALLPLDGTPVTVRDKTIAMAALEAGWLAITIRVVAPNNRGATNVHRDVYVVSRDQLTIWRNFTIEWPDGSLSSTVCSYRQVVVYQRQK